MKMSQMNSKEDNSNDTLFSFKTNKMITRVEWKFLTML